jgi:23S rRNA (cytosine1962-C5)-methyltransferase
LIGGDASMNDKNEMDDANEIDETAPAVDPNLREKYEKQAEMLANRVAKRFRHLRKRFSRQGIEAFRLYDWDIPEIRAVVDWYGGHAVVGEYTRKQSTPEWLPMMGEAVGRALEIPSENVHLKERVYGKSEGERYGRIDYTDRMIVVSERDLKFYVNPWDYVDTGLFSDHRDTRQMVRESAEGKDFLNLFCYTASFSCYAAKGGARSTVSVDRSQTAVEWARKNMDLNGIPEESNRIVHQHTFSFLKKAKSENMRFDLAVVDPPSFYTRRTTGDYFDIVRDHPVLLAAVVELMREGGVVYFSTNHQKFKPNTRSLKISKIKEITPLTIPEDYVSKRKKIHRCWRIVV